MKLRAAESQEATHAIMTSFIGGLDEKHANHLPKINTLKKTIVRSRNKAKNVPPEPISLQHLNIPDSYSSTEKGEHFLLYDSGAEGGNQRIIIFGANVEQLSTAAVWLADSTVTPNVVWSDQFLGVKGIKEQWISVLIVLLGRM